MSAKATFKLFLNKKTEPQRFLLQLSLRATRHPGDVKRQLIQDIATSEFSPLNGSTSVATITEVNKGQSSSYITLSFSSVTLASLVQVRRNDFLVGFN